MIKTSKVELRRTRKDELERLMQIESHFENRPELFVSSYEEHLFHLESQDYLLLSIYVGRVMEGYAMVQLNHQSRTFLLRRIAIMTKNQGYGRSALAGLIKYCFEELEMNRFYLDVYPHNARAIHLYESLGLVWEGTLRQNYLYQGSFLDQRLYSMLREEYEKSSLSSECYLEL